MKIGVISKWKKANPINLPLPVVTARTGDNSGGESHRQLLLQPAGGEDDQIPSWVDHEKIVIRQPWAESDV